MIRSTSPSDEHQEDLTAQVGQEDQEGQTTLTAAHTSQLFLPAISSLSNPPETLDPLEYLPYSSMATELELTPLSESFGFT